MAGWGGCGPSPSPELSEGQVISGVGTWWKGNLASFLLLCWAVFRPALPVADPKNKNAYCHKIVSALPSPCTHLPSPPKEARGEITIS